MTKSTKQSKVIAVPVDQPDNANAVVVDPVASDYTQVKDQTEKSVENPIEPVQTVVAVGAEPVVKSKPKARAKSKVKTEVNTTQLDKGIVMDENPFEVVKPVEAVEPVVKEKAKAKAKPVEPVKQEPAAETVAEPVVEEPKPKAKAKAKQEVMECKDCGKKLTAKTLKHNHVYNCPAKKQQEQPPAQPEQPVQREQPVKPPENIMQTATKRLRKLKQERAIRNQEKVKHLIAQGF